MNYLEKMDKELAYHTDSHIKTREVAILKICVKSKKKLFKLFYAK